MSKRHAIFIGIIVLTLTFCGCDYFGPGMADYSYKLSDKYKLIHAGETFIWKDNDAKEGIECNIIGIAWDKNFILAEQSKDNNLCYYILDVNTDRTYGPLTEDDFKSKINELKVSDKLRLVNPDKYKILDESNI